MNKCDSAQGRSQLAFAGGGVVRLPALQNYFGSAAEATKIMVRVARGNTPTGVTRLSPQSWAQEIFVENGIADLTAI